MNPILSCNCLLDGDEAIFLFENKKVKVEAPNEVLKFIIEECTLGKTPLTELLEKSKWDIASLMDFLIEKGILLDGNDVTRLWRQVKNPVLTGKLLTNNQAVDLRNQGNLAELPSTAIQFTPTVKSQTLLNRKSVRVFTKENIPTSKLINMLWAAYGNGDEHRTAGSGGAMYTLQLNLVLLRKTDDLEIGVYEVSYDLKGNVGLSFKRSLPQTLFRAWMDLDILSTAQGIVILTSSFKRTQDKYSMRALPAVLLESGAVAQNFITAGIEQKVATTQYLGFYDDILKDSLGTEKNPLLTIFFGNEDVTPVRRPGYFSWRNVTPGQYTGQTYDSVTDTSCTSTDSDPLVAYSKSVAELYERISCGSLDNFKTSTINKIGDVIHPTKIISYTDEQYLTPGFRFKKFDPNYEYKWCFAKSELTEKTYALLADHVYYSFTYDRKYTSSNTSGVAAHYDRNLAVQNGMLELIERDAFMRTWLTGAATPTVDQRSLPAELQRRILALKDRGYSMTIKDIGYDYVPAYLIYSKHDSGRVSVSGCANYSCSVALTHGFDEHESILNFMESNPSTPANETKVLTPADHARIYLKPEYAHHSDRLLRSTNLAPFGSTSYKTCANMVQLLDRFKANKLDVLTVNISSKRTTYVPVLNTKGVDTKKLLTIRTIVPGLIPITFGYASEPLGLLRAESKYFPHPFP